MDKKTRPHGVSRRTFVKASLTAGATLVMRKGRALEGKPHAPLREAEMARVGSGSTCLLRFAHITDTHYYLIDKTRPDFEQFKSYMTSRMGWQTEEPMSEVYAELERRGVNLALNTGDIVDYVSDEDLQFFARHAAQIPFEVHYCLGNHDFNTLEFSPDGEPVWGWMDEDENIEAWKRNVPAFRERYYSAVHSGVRFIMLENGRRRFDHEQVRWLDRELGASKEPCILGFHIPLHSEELEEFCQRPDLLMPPNPKIPIYDVLAGHSNVAAIFAGHLHRDFRTEINGVPQFTTGAAYHRSFRIVECYG